MSEGKVKIGKEIAEKELQRFANIHDIDLDDKANEPHKNRLIRAMVDGFLEFVEQENGKLIAIQTTTGGTKLEYGAVTGQSRVEMQKHDNTVEGLYAFLGHVTKQGPDVMKLLENRDAKIMDAIAVFLAA